MLKGVVFDLDGTLVDSLATTIEAFNQGILSQGGRRYSAQEILSFFGPYESEIFAQILGPDKAAEAYRVCRAYMDGEVGKMPLFDGIPEILDHLKDQKLPLAIVTGRSSSSTEIILKHHGITHQFVTVVCHDHISSPKPSPEGIHLALSRMNLKPEEVCYVGDSWVDAKAARRAGATSIACLWDLLADRESIEPYEPHHWAEKPAELLEIWEQLGLTSE